MNSDERYKTLTDSHGDADYSRLLCTECSTPSTGVLIPADERDEHDAWHDSLRHAVVEGRHADLDAIRRYLPSNFEADSDGKDVFIHGRDHAGWTLDDYVIPRLASGLYVAREVSTHVVVTGCNLTQADFGPGPVPGETCADGGTYYEHPAS